MSRYQAYTQRGGGCTFEANTLKEAQFLARERLGGNATGYICLSNDVGKEWMLHQTWWYDDAIDPDKCNYGYWDWWIEN